jgi:hypothetical protein
MQAASAAFAQISIKLHFFTPKEKNYIDSILPF